MKKFTLEGRRHVRRQEAKNLRPLGEQTTEANDLGKEMITPGHILVEQNLNWKHFVTS